MKRSLLILALASFMVSCKSQNVVDSTCYNMDINNVENGKPTNWVPNTQHSDYIFSLDTVALDDYCLVIKSPESRDSQFGSWSNTITDSFLGEQLTVSGCIKTKNVTQGYAGIWVRVDPNVSFANMNKNGVVGNSEWRKYEISVPYDSVATQIVFGGMLIGEGEAWFDDFSISIDGVPVCALSPIHNNIINNDSVFNQSILNGGLSDAQKTHLFDICKIWGALKYAHPSITNGKIDMDLELAKLLPAVLNTGDEDSVQSIITTWCQSFNDTQIPENNTVAPNWSYSNTSPYISNLINDFWPNKFPKKSHYIEVQNNGVPHFQHEKKYETIQYPSQTLQILALFRFWNAVQYYYPNIESIPNWDNILKKYIPIFFEAETESDYLFALNMISHEIFDGHSQVYMENDPYKMLFGAKKPKLGVKFIENKLYVSQVDESLSNVITRGTEINSINGKNVIEICNARKCLTSSANDEYTLLKIGEEILRTNADSLILTISTESSNRACHKTVPVYSIPQIPHEAEVDTCYKEFGDIGYINIGSLQKKHLGEIWKSVRKTKALVVDCRSYPKEYILYSLGNMLANATSNFAKIRKLKSIKPRDFEIINAEPLRGNGMLSYKHPVYVLIDENTFSQAEYTALALKSLPNAKLVGRRTSGTDGDIAPLWLPGGALTGFSGVSILDPSGQSTYRKGLLPDIEIKSTVDELINSSDSILDYIIELSK